MANAIDIGAIQYGGIDIGAIETGDLSLSPAPASLIFTGGTPVLDKGLEPTAASLVFTGATPTVTLVGFNLTPATATLTFTPGTPTINIVNLSPSVGRLTFIGATPGVSLVQASASGTVAIIGGTSYYWDDNQPAKISKRLSSAWSAVFEIIYTSGSKPTCGQDVALFWNSTKIFGGLVQTIDESRIKGPDNRTRILVTCTGYQSILNRVVVAKLYTLPISGWQPIIFDIWDTHLKSFGITMTYPQGPGSGFDEKLFHYITAAEIFNRVRDENSGWDYWITDDKQLIWKQQSAGTAAPFTLRNGDANQDSITVSTSNSKFRNRQWVLPSASLLALKSESFTAIAGQTVFSTQYAQTVTPLISVNGTYQNVTTLGVWDGSPWYYILNGIGVFRSPGAPVLGAGDAVVVSYPNPFPIAFSAENASSIASVGLFESVYQAKNVIDEGTATSLAAALLNLYGTSGTFAEVVKFTYNSQSQSAWTQPGMIFDVNRTFPTALGNYCCEEVTSTLEKLRVWRHSLTLRFGQGDASESFERDFLAAARVPIVSTPIRATFELDMTNEGQSVGLSPNRWTVQLPLGVVQATIKSWDGFFPADPPTGQNYIADILLNGSSIFPVGNANKANIPAGSTAIASGIKFVSNNITVVNGDIFSFNVLQVGSTLPGKYALFHVNMVA